MIEFIAGFVVNLLTNLIYDGYLDKKDREKIEKIQERIIDFNRRYDNTELDTNTFDKFLKTSKVDEKVFNFVFKNFEQEPKKIHAFKIEIAQNAIEVVNVKYEERGRLKIKDNDIFFDYFDKLIEEIISIRHDILNLHEKAMAATIIHEVRDTGDKVIKEIKEEIWSLKSDNIFAEDLIESVIELVNQWKNALALELISKTLEDSDQLSLNQKELLLFQRARVFINQKKFEALVEVQGKITKINNKSKYIYEIDFYISKEKRDEKLLEVTLQRFKELNYSEEKLKLKKVEYTISDGKFTDLITDYLINNEILKEEFTEYPEAHFYQGLFFIYNDKYLEAQIAFEKAYAIKSSVIYYYYALIANYNVLVTEEDAKFNKSEEFLFKINELTKKLEEIEYITTDFDLQDKSNYWSLLISLFSMLDKEKALQKIEAIPADIKTQPVILNRVAGIYFMNGKDEKALDILESLEGYSYENIIQMFLIYSYQKKWDKIIELYERQEDATIVDDGIITLLYLLAKYKMSSFEVVIADIQKHLSKDKFKAFEADILIDILCDHKDSEHWGKLLEVIIKHYHIFHAIEKEKIAGKLIVAGEKQLAQSLLEPYLDEGENLFNLYLQTIESLERLNEETRKLYDIVKKLYESGIRHQTLLKSKCSIERMLDNKRKAIETLIEYKKMYGCDYYYALYYVETMLQANDVTNLNEEISYLLSSKQPDALLLVAHVYSAREDWSNAQETALDAIYQTNSISKENLMNYISLYLLNTDKEDDEINFNEVNANTVVTLRKLDEEGQERDDESATRVIAIHKNVSRVVQSGEIRFDCENYSTENAISLILESNGYINEEIELEDGKYKINEIMYIHVYMFRYCWAKLDRDHPNHGFYCTVATDDVNTMIEDIKKIMSASNKQKEKDIGLYNFKDNPIGLPVAALSGKEPTRYVQILINILHMENQPVYTGEVSQHDSEKYILSLSSIVLLNELGFLNKLKQIEDRIFITPSVISDIELGIKISRKEAKSQVGNMSLSDSDNLSMVEYTEDNKKEWKSYWAKLRLAIMSIPVIDGTIDDHDIYNSIANWVMESDIQSIEAAKKNRHILVSDDLFIRKIARSVTNEDISTNIVGFLLEVGVLSYEEAFDMIYKLARFHYVYAVNEIVLFQLYQMLLVSGDGAEVDQLWLKFKETLESLLNDITGQYYFNVVKEFLQLVFEKRLFTKKLYDIIQRPMKLKPYQEQVEEVIKQMFDIDK